MVRKQLFFTSCPSWNTDAALQTRFRWLWQRFVSSDATKQSNSGVTKHKSLSVRLSEAPCLLLLQNFCSCIATHYMASLKARQRQGHLTSLCEVARIPLDASVYVLPSHFSKIPHLAMIWYNISSYSLSQHWMNSLSNILLFFSNFYVLCLVAKSPRNEKWRVNSAFQKDHKTVLISWFEDFWS